MLLQQSLKRPNNGQLRLLFRKACAKREDKEETGLIISHLQFVSITNDIFIDEDKHDFLIFLVRHV